MTELQQNSPQTPSSDRPQEVGQSATTAVWKRALKLLGLYLIIAVIGRLLEDAFGLTNLISSEGRGDPPIAGIVLVSCLTFAWTLFGSAMALTLTARLLFLQTTVRGLSAFREVELIAIETIRAISASLVRLPLLLLPALYEWIRLTPIPFIILFDPAYQKGEVDALKGARRFFKEHRARVIFFLGLTFGLFLLEFALADSPSDSLPLWQAPLQHMGSILFFSLLRLGCDCWTLHGYASKFPKLTAPLEASSHSL